MKSNVARSMKNRIAGHMDKLIAHVDNVETDLFESKSTIRLLMAENSRLKIRLEKYEPVASAEGDIDLSRPF